MTPAERQYDLDLVRSLRQQAAWIEPRIGKLAVLMRQAADRLEAVSLEMASAMPARQTLGYDSGVQPATLPSSIDEGYDYGQASDPREVHQQWTRDGKPIPGEEGPSYTVQPDDADRVGITTTGTNPPQAALPSMAPTGGPDLPGYMENRSKNAPPQAASPDQPARKRRNPRS